MPPALFTSELQSGDIKPINDSQENETFQINGLKICILISSYFLRLHHRCILLSCSLEYKNNLTCVFLRVLAMQTILKIFVWSAGLSGETLGHYDSVLFTDKATAKSYLELG